MVIVKIDETNIEDAAMIHSKSWQESHRAFCTPDFIELHSPEHQRVYLEEKLAAGSLAYMLIDDMPVGVVSVTGSLIEDLYILPERQNMGYGSELLKYAISKCSDVPTLWILENNKGAERLYRRKGFAPTGRVNVITPSLKEIEFALHYIK